MASDTQYEVTFDNVALGAEDRIGAAGTGWATWQEVLEPGLVLLGGPGRRGSPLRARDHDAVRARPRSSTSHSGAFQALAHNLADAVTRLDGAEQLVHEAAWAGATGRPLDLARPHGQALRLRDLPRHHRHGPAALRRHRLHAGLRHPALLPASQAQQMMWANDRALEDAVAAALLD